jgi:hypothetical protein
VRYAICVPVHVALQYEVFSLPAAAVRAFRLGKLPNYWATKASRAITGR